MQLRVEPPLPGKILGHPLGQAFDGELLEVIAQLRLRHQSLVFTAQAGLTGTPAMRADVERAIGQALQFRRSLQTPGLTAGLHVAAGQAPTPIALVERAIEDQGRVELRPLQVQVELLLFDIALAADRQHAQ
ncbi:hypothetical protein D3C78_1646650 [compost metagenome]